MACNSQPHRSTGIAPLELVIPRRIPNLTVRNLPPGTPLANTGTLKDGSASARKRDFVAHLRRKIPVVVNDLRKTQGLSGFAFRGEIGYGYTPMLRI